MPRLAAIASICLLTGSAAAAPLLLEPVAINGVQYEDLPGEITATLPRSSINNHGQWSATVIASNGDGGSAGRFILSNDGIRYDPRVGIELGPDLVIDPWGNAYLNSAINNLGQIVATARGPAFDAQGNPQGFRSVVLFDGAPVVQTGDMTPFGFAYPDDFHSSRPVLNDQGTVVTNFGFGFSPLTEFDTVLRFEAGSSGEYLPTVEVFPGMTLPDGSVVAQNNRANGGSYDLNSLGSSIVGVGAAFPNESPRGVLLVDGQIVAEGGATDLLPGGSLNLNAALVTLNHEGEFAYFGYITGDDWIDPALVVVRNGDELVWMDDGTDPKLTGYSIGTFQNSLLISDLGDVFWQADIYDSIGARYSAFFQNDELIATSDPTIDGVLHIDGLFRTQVSDNGQWAIFDTQDGVFRARIPAPGTAAILTLGMFRWSTRQRPSPAV